MTTKRGIANPLRMVLASGANPFAESRCRLPGLLMHGLPMDGLAHGLSGSSGDGRRRDG